MHYPRGIIIKFENAIEIILKSEGGYVNDSNDPGGETNFGISKRQYPDLDIKNLTRGHAKLIYQADYWNVCKCEGLPDEIRLMVFDCAVNQGVFRASKILQEILKVEIDGMVGPKTIGAANNYKSGLLVKYAKSRIMLYSKTINFDIYGHGWVTRVLNILMH